MYTYSLAHQSIPERNPDPDYDALYQVVADDLPRDATQQEIEDEMEVRRAERYWLGRWS